MMLQTSVLPMTHKTVSDLSISQLFLSPLPRVHAMKCTMKSFERHTQECAGLSFKCFARLIGKHGVNMPFKEKTF